jgi:hypothetical protein
MDTGVGIGVGLGMGVMSVGWTHLSQYLLHISFLSLQVSLEPQQKNQNKDSNRYWHIPLGRLTVAYKQSS